MIVLSKASPSSWRKSTFLHRAEFQWSGATLTDAAGEQRNRCFVVDAHMPRNRHSSDRAEEQGQNRTQRPPVRRAEGFAFGTGSQRRERSLKAGPAGA